jgi:hypothetical protein
VGGELPITPSTQCPDGVGLMLRVEVSGAQTPPLHGFCRLEGRQRLWRVSPLGGKVAHVAVAAPAV